MEAIRNYLETMFLNLPNTPQVLKAKEELWQMMEDKYTELKNEGKSENEAVGTVIAEFGNLDEIAKDLGIDQVISHADAPEGTPLSLENAKNYLRDYSRFAFRISLGVLLCIISVFAPIMFSAVGEMTGNEDVLDALGGGCMFVVVAIAVGLFVYAGITNNKWNYLRKERFVTDFATTEYLHQAYDSYKPTYALLMTIGIILCVISFVPAIIFDAFSPLNPFMENMGGAFLFIFVGIGVFFIVFSAMRHSSFTFLLHLNEKDTVGGNYTTSQQNENTYRDKTASAIMSVYWPTITCLYLIWSFLSFDWHFTWIIWPIAGIVHTLLKNLWSD